MLLSLAQKRERGEIIIRPKTLNKFVSNALCASAWAGCLSFLPFQLSPAKPTINICNLHYYYYYNPSQKKLALTKPFTGSFLINKTNRKLKNVHVFFCLV